MIPSVLKVESAGKSYADYASTFHRLASWFGVKVALKNEFWANRNISFELRAGEALAVIGQNGAGKSTLLKMITGTVRPNEGKIHVDGRLNAILELGIGFNPDLTGRENVFHSGGLMGYSQRELQSVISYIQDFAEIGDFFDQPLRVYSSGMQARLAFSLATAIRPDILIVDEVLSVGDSYFQHKSFNRIRQLKESGTSIIMVTHSMGTVREICDRVILLDKGLVRKEGRPDEVVDFYNAIIAEKENSKLSIEQRRRKDGWLHTEYGNKMAIMKNIDLFKSGDDAPILLAETGDILEVRTEIEIIEPLETLVLGHRISDHNGHVVWGTNTWHTQQILENLQPGAVVKAVLNFRCDLGPGSYSISFGVHKSDTHLASCYHKADNQIVFDVMNTKKPTFIGSSYLDSEFLISVSE